MNRIRFPVLVLGALLAGCVGVKTVPRPQTPAEPTLKAAVPATSMQQESRLLRLDYEGFTVWLDCQERAPVKFRYNAKADSGSQARSASFKLDPDAPQECQQKSSAAYGNGYDRGHQVPANHLDGSAVAIQQSNYMTNILPQTSQMNRGAWLLTEEIIECYRDLGELLVMGGVIWGNDPTDDWFEQSHGVRTPDAFWKVVVRGTGEAIAWVLPNTKEATRSRLDSYIVTAEEIETLAGEKLPVAEEAQTAKPHASWPLPAGCDKG